MRGDASGLIFAHAGKPAPGDAVIIAEPSPLGSPEWGLLVAVAACVVASAFFSFSETCLTSLSASTLHALIGSGSRRARVLQVWLERPHSVLTTILIGNTLANIAATATLTRFVLHAAGEAAVPYVVGGMTVVILVVSEITPKTLARQHAERFAVPTMLGLRVVHVLFTPVTWSLTWISAGAMRLLGMRADASRDVTEAEIQAMIDLASREGTISDGKAQYLRGVFALSQRTVREVMVARTDVVAVDLGMDPDELVRHVDDAGHSRIPVHEGSIDEIVGVLHAKDLLHLLATADATPRSDQVEALLREPLFVPETMRLDKLLRFFRRNRQHLVVVLDEFGGTAGIATLEDVLEELVGEIWDEHDDAEPVLVRRGADRWTADGRLALTVLEERLGLELPAQGEADTLGGLLMELAGEVPKSGARFELGTTRFEVIGADDRRVGLVRITRQATDAPA